MVDVITPPWPAFMIAASTRHLPITADPSHQSVLARFLKALTKSTQSFVAPENYETSIAFVQEKMSYTRQDVQDWFKGVKYPVEAGCDQISEEALVHCAKTLVEVGVIQKGQEADVKERLRTKYVDNNVAQLI